MKTSLGIWAFGAMATRFNPGGYKPELAGASTVEKVRSAVAGLEGLIDDYEFHYPQELSAGNLAEVRGALDGHGIYCVASGLHLDPRFGKGAFSSPDDRVRAAGCASLVATASGCSARKLAGMSTPSMSWRSSQTFATDRAASVSSRRSAAARAAGLRAALRRSVASTSRSPVDRETPAGRAEIARAAVTVRAWTCAVLLSVQPEGRQ